MTGGAHPTRASRTSCELPDVTVTALKITASRHSVASLWNWNVSSLQSESRLLLAHPHAADPYGKSSRTVASAGIADLTVRNHAHRAVRRG